MCWPLLLLFLHPSPATPSSQHSLPWLCVLTVSCCQSEINRNCRRVSSDRRDTAPRVLRTVSIHLLPRTYYSLGYARRPHAEKPEKKVGNTFKTGWISSLAQVRSFYPDEIFVDGTSPPFDSSSLGPSTCPLHLQYGVYSLGWSARTSSSLCSTRGSGLYLSTALASHSVHQPDGLCRHECCRDMEAFSSMR